MNEKSKKVAATGSRVSERESLISFFPRSVEHELAEHDLPPEYAPDDDLGMAEADYRARLELWRSRNGLDGGLEAFDLLVRAARRFRHLHAASGVAE